MKYPISTYFKKPKLIGKFWLRVIGKLLSYTGFAIFITGFLQGNMLDIGLGIMVAAIGCYIHEVGEE
jgi:hypothetical protein